MQDRGIGNITMFCIVVVAILCFLATPTWADEEADVARQIMNKWQNSVITVQLTLEQQIGGFTMQKTESKAEAIGTVIDPSGLTVLSLFSTDPLARILALVRGSLLSEQDMAMFQWESQIKDVKLLMADGNEVPAKIVLRDKDLDLAFVRPVDKLTTPLTAVDLTKAGKPEVLDQVVILTRLGKVASREPSVSLSRVQAIVKKPRTFYVPGSDAMEGGFGAAAFCFDGKVAGVLVLRALISRDIGINSIFSGMKGLGMLPVILPAEDILEVAKQAPEVTEEKKAEKEKAAEKETK